MSRVVNALTALVLAGAATVSAATPAQAAAEPEIIPIDLLLAGDWVDAAREAIQIWNEAAPTIKFVEQDTVAALRVKAYTTAAGTSSHVYIAGAGRGWVYLENGDAVTYKPSRVVAHELGHMLSLKDIAASDIGTPAAGCDKLMSGGHAGPTCQNDHPDSAEIAEVLGFFEQNDVGDPVPWFHS